MKVTYGDKIQQLNNGYDLLREATKRLEEIIGPSADLVTAEWDKYQDARGRVLYTVKLSDFAGEASKAFTPDELRSPHDLRGRLLDLWGDLLQAQSDAQVRKIQQLVQQVD